MIFVCACPQVLKKKEKDTARSAFFKGTAAPYVRSLTHGNTCMQEYAKGIFPSQILFGRRYSGVSASGELIRAEIVADIPSTGLDLEALFRAQYARIAGLIARVVRDQARAEELAVEVFLKLSRDRRAMSENAEGWLYRAAARMALDELRRRTRRERYEKL